MRVPVKEPARVPVKEPATAPVKVLARVLVTAPVKVPGKEKVPVMAPVMAPARVPVKEPVRETAFRLPPWARLHRCHRTHSGQHTNQRPSKGPADVYLSCKCSHQFSMRHQSSSRARRVFLDVPILSCMPTSQTEPFGMRTSQ